MSVYERIESLRKQANISQGKLEKELGFSNGSISKWKKSMPNPERLSKIAAYFGTTVEFLMTGELKRTYLEDSEVSLLIALAEKKGYEVNESLNADMGVTLTIKAPDQEQSVDLRNHEIKELINQMKNFALENMVNMINQKYVNGEYHKERTEEELIEYIFGDDRSAEDALAELSTYEDAEIVSFIRKANELKKQKLNAAHTRTDVTPTSEDILHDEDIMDDVDF